MRGRGSPCCWGRCVDAVDKTSLGEEPSRQTGGSEGDVRWDLSEVSTQDYVADHTGTVRNRQQNYRKFFWSGVLHRTNPPAKGCGSNNSSLGEELAGCVFGGD